MRIAVLVSCDSSKAGALFNYMSIVSGNLIGRFTYLEDLQLDFGPFQFRLNIYDVLLPLKNLRKLKIVGLGQMPQLPTTEMFGALESFCICNSIICQIDLPVCPKLKQIGFWSNFCPSSILFKWIFDHATTLEKVSIAVEGLNKDNIFEIIKKCKFLRDFHLKMEIESFISKEFVGKVNDILKSNGYTSEKPIVLVLPNNSFERVEQIVSFK